MYNGLSIEETTRRTKEGSKSDQRKLSDISRRNIFFLFSVLILGTEKFQIVTNVTFDFFVSIFWIIFNPKNKISTALIIENSVKSPIVPPMAEI